MIFQGTQKPLVNFKHFVFKISQFEIQVFLFSYIFNGFLVVTILVLTIAVKQTNQLCVIHERIPRVFMLKFEEKKTK